MSDWKSEEERSLGFPPLLLVVLTFGALMALHTLFASSSSSLFLFDLLTFSRWGAVASLLATLGILALVIGCDRVRRLASLALLGYSLGQGLWLLDQVNRQVSLEALPAMSLLLMLLFAFCLWHGRGVGRRRYAALGIVCMVAGALGFSILWTTEDAPRWRLILFESRPLGTVMVFTYGVIFWLFARQRSLNLRRLAPRVIKVGLIGTSLSMLVGFGGYHLYSLDLKQDLSTQLDTLSERIANWEERYRLGWSEWSLPLTQAGGSPEPTGPAARGEVLAYVWWQDRGALRWNPADGGGATSRLEEMLALHEVRSWLEQRQNEAMRWWIPGKGAALLEVNSFGAAGPRLVVLVDTTLWLEHMSEGLTANLSLLGLRPAEALDHGAREVWVERGRLAGVMRDDIALAGGTLLRVQASKPLSLKWVLLPALLLALGLFVTYQLMTWIALARLRREQAISLATREQEFHSLFGLHPVPMLQVRRSGLIGALNDSATEALGDSAGEAIARPFTEVASRLLGCGDAPDELMKHFDNVMTGRQRSVVFECSIADSTFRIRLQQVRVGAACVGLFASFADISLRQKEQARLSIMEHCLRESSNGVVIFDAQSRGCPVMYANAALCRMLDASASSVTGLLASELARTMCLDPVTEAEICHWMKTQQPGSVTALASQGGGGGRWYDLTLSPVHALREGVSHYIGIVDDVSQRKVQEEMLAHQATHDALTGLPNRTLLADRLEHDVALATRHRQGLAVLFIDLDAFKPINDSLGHEVGDRVLIQVAKRLSRGQRRSDTLARLGGDEFVLVLVDIGGKDKAIAVAERLLNQLREPCRVDGFQLQISASIGIALLDTGTTLSPQRLIQQADLAMYQAKQRGRNQYQLFTRTLDGVPGRHVTLRNALRIAMEQQRLQLFYQPQVDGEGRITGLEALIRWSHPEFGWVSPSEFIPLAEETGQIIDLGRWVMRRACYDAKRLWRSGLKPGRVAVNLSPLEFHRMDFLSSVCQTLDQTHLHAECLELEITEGMLLDDQERVARTLGALAARGVTTAIDDFGKGYSSFDYLKSLPIDKIKIDRGFVAQCLDSERDIAVCRSVITLAQELGLEALAEGVETPHQCAALKDLGCTTFQGYLFSRPVPFRELAGLLRRPHLAPQQEVPMDRQDLIGAEARRR
ncbi:hypothetical protein C6W88_02485 [Halomonas litopenaei]|uniref:EAL domain-containing protein n=1 Tax=Halomonas litopenaei TaxID=2109328 RepID=A0ABX5J1N5_9GAMM|nr:MULTISPECIES: bifunctional diguanylate cyclase/phosphodiesterase [Halomonas]PTL92827.1 hypothetical protein C6W89_02680 [Halomonas sp. SYSU XM8]PTL96270.1 hypothetical protein C6W88_02485 [Halomonas litopenaei]